MKTCLSSDKLMFDANKNLCGYIAIKKDRLKSTSPNSKYLLNFTNCETPQANGASFFKTHSCVRIVLEWEKKTHPVIHITCKRKLHSTYQCNYYVGTPFNILMQLIARSTDGLKPIFPVLFLPLMFFIMS